MQFVQDEDWQYEQCQVSACIDAGCSEEVLIQVDTSPSHDGEVPVLLDGLADPSKAKCVQHAVDDRYQHHCIHSNAKSDFERRYLQIKESER